MESKVLVETPLTGPLERVPGDVPPPCLDIAIDDRSGSIQVRDARSFHPGRRAFCRRLIEAAARQPGIGKAEIDLDSATCRIQFDPASSSARAAAEALSVAVGQAAANTRSARTLPWWRPERPWSSLTAYQVPGDVSLWETLERAPGRVKVRHSGAPSDRSRLTRLRDSIARLGGVESCGVCAWTHTLVIEHPFDSPILPRLLDTLERTLRAPIDADAQALQASRVTGPKRLLYLSFAGGCLALTAVGLVIPGVPTVPFLLATSYFLARSSPALDERLRRTSIVGPILVDWETHEALSAASKAKLIGLTVTIVLVTITFAPLSTPVRLLVVLIACVSVLGVLELPGIKPEPSDAPALNGSAQLALPGP